jgi:hypothetical protein
MNSLLFSLKKLFYCQGSVIYVGKEGRTCTSKLSPASSIDVGITDHVKILAYMCACAEMKSGGCSRFKLIRNRLSKSMIWHDLHVVSSTKKIKADVSNRNGERRAIDYTDREVLLARRGHQYVDWRNQHFYSIIVHRTPGIDKAKHCADDSNGQGNCLKYGDFLHVSSFQNKQIEKDITQ